MKNQKNKKITHLNTYSINKTLDNIRHYKRKKFVRFRTVAILVVGILLIISASLPLITNKRSTNEYTKVHAEAVENLANLQSKKEELEYTVGLLEDEEYIAKLARQELNVSKSNEILINIPEKEETVDDTSKETTEDNEDAASTENTDDEH